jgi:uncharacterized protein Yka (UPF0111/DUF47 family)
VSPTLPGRVGFARLPATLRQLLAEAVANAEAAAVALHTLAAEPRLAGRRANEVARLEGEGDRIRHDIQHELRERLVLGSERVALVGVADALDDVVDAIEDAAFRIAHAGGGLDRDRIATLAAVLRDLVRVAARPLLSVEEAGSRSDALHERTHTLREELRQDLRAAKAAAFDDRVDPLDAVRAESVLTGLRLVGEATERLDARIRTLAGEVS